MRKTQFGELYCEYCGTPTQEIEMLYMTSRETDLVCIDCYLEYHPEPIVTVHAKSNLSANTWAALGTMVQAAINAMENGTLGKP